jgi:ribosomal protein S18 acetylase RimI-like enzyme
LLPLIRPFQAQDWPQLWPLLQSVFARGDTYAFSPESTEADIYSAWINQPQATYVALSEAGDLLATYILKPNQPGLGSHVCNCGYVVAQAARGRGVAALLCEHSQDRAREFDYRAMQFNLVVSSNEVAVRLWKKLGFSIVGTLPRAFNHSRLGYVDAYVMHKSLVA